MSDAVQIVAIVVTGLVAMTLGVGAIVHGIIFSAKAGPHGAEMQAGDNHEKKSGGSEPKRPRSNRNK